MLDKIFEAGNVDAVMHFAGFIQVGESVLKPSMYYDNNVARTLTLLDAMLRHDVKHFIFSSTAAIFGEPDYTPIDEKHAKKPINPYGHSKLMIEQVLEDYDSAYGLRSTCLRYFNAAGADPDGELGERHVPETHLIPLILQAASGRRDDIKVFGDDYATDDGTCVRDYIHINDLCEAHLQALQDMIRKDSSARYNLGNGRGFSVKQVIDIAKQVSGNDFTVSIEPRRAGDPAVLVADATLARKVLNWQPKFAELKDIVNTAWQWETGFLCKQ